MLVSTLVGGKPYQSGARMLVIWFGALLLLGGLVFIAAQPIWRERLSEARRRRSSAVPRDTLEPHTLEPRRPGAGFGLKENWPGLVFLTSGGILFTKCAHRAHRAADPALRNPTRGAAQLTEARDRVRSFGGHNTSRRRCLASLKAAWGLHSYLPALRLPFFS